MPFIYVLPIIALIVSGSAFATGSDLTNETKKTNETKRINQSYLYGNWNCKGEMQHKQLKMDISFDYNINFTKDLNSTGKGLVSFTIPNVAALDYQLVDNSTWKIQGDEIFYTSNDLKLINVSHPEFEKIINLEKLMPRTMSESSKILLLTKTKLEIQPKIDKKIYFCTKQ